VIPALDPATGALPPGDHRATLEEIGGRFGFTPRRRWLLRGLRAAVRAFWTAGIEDIFIDGSFCTEKPDPGDVDGYWVEPDDGVYDRIDPYWIDFEMIGARSEMEVADVGGSRRGVFHPSRHARKTGGRVSGVFPPGSRRAAEGGNSGS
jgi:hypothetical protein